MTAAPRIRSILEDSRFDWSPEGEGFVTVHDATRIHAAVDGGVAMFRTRLVRFPRHLSEHSRAALGEFLVALNSRLRFTRGSLIRDQEVALEVEIPMSALDAAAVDRAACAIAVGAAAARDSCAVLLCDEMAAEYLSFHTKGRFEYADADC